MKTHMTFVATTLLLAAFAAPAPAQSGDPESAPVATRLFLMPTGRMLEPASGYVDVIGFGVAQFQGGATRWLSFGVGTLSPIFSGGRPVWLTPKIAVVNTERVHAAAGTVHYFAPDSNGGFGYGVVTFGTNEAGMTVGMVQGYGDVTSDARAVMLGFDRQKSDDTQVMVEATIGRHGGLVIAGVRRTGKKFSADFGMAVPLGGNSPLIALPIVNFGWRF